MEEASLRVIHLLVRAIIPSGLIAAIVGVAMIGSALVKPPAASESRRVERRIEENEQTDMLEKIAVALCALVALLGVVAVVQTIRYRHGSPAYPPLAILLSGALLTLSLPAFLWRTRLRLLGEGVATIAVAVVAFLSGFTMGFLFVPLVLLMTFVCLRHLFHRFARSQRPSPIAVG